ncbi:isoaspartyl peptidase/L-asparaginase [Halobacteriales archaeon Cl-PHB]
MHVCCHGGAGSAPADPEARQADLDDAAAAAADESDPWAAVCAGVRRLEANGRFNAGVGGAVQSDGVIRTDAGLMHSDGSVGAACAMPGVEHAVDVASLVAEETPHVLLAGDRALDLAGAFDVATDRDLWTDRSRERWAEADPPTDAALATRLEWIREHFGGNDTVGAVATDREHLAAATSTGGRWFALAGRVGDVPQVGAGFYATETAAASATGEGEEIARFGLARQVVDAVEEGDDPQTAVDRVLRGFETETGGRAGVIVVDHDGQRASAYNSEAMQTAGASD